jgi:hypothetical protein
MVSPTNLRTGHMSILEALIYIVRFPYEAGKKLDEESRVGQSEEDRKSRQFWKWFAWIATAIILSVPLAILILWLILTH